MEDGLLAFIMRDRVTHTNIRGNSHDAYLFKEEGFGYLRRLEHRVLREIVDVQKGGGLFQIDRFKVFFYPADG